MTFGDEFNAAKCSRCHGDGVVCQFCGHAMSSCTTSHAWRPCPKCASGDREHRRDESCAEVGASVRGSWRRGSPPSGGQQAPVNGNAGYRERADGDELFDLRPQGDIGSGMGCMGWLAVAAAVGAAMLLIWRG